MSEGPQNEKSDLLTSIHELGAEQALGEAHSPGEIKQVLHDSEANLLTAFFRSLENPGVKFQRLKADNGDGTREFELRIEIEKCHLLEGIRQSNATLDGLGEHGY